MSLSEIARQPLEVRGILNPALISVMAYRVAEGCYKKNRKAVTLLEMYVCLSLLLHRPTFDVIPTSKRTKFQGWLHDYQEIRINLHDRMNGLRPYIGAGIILALENGFLVINDQARLLPGKKAPRKPFSDNNDYGADVQIKASYLGSALSDVQPPSFFLTILGLSL